MSIKENLELVKQNIANAAVKAGKRPEDIVLVMATKTVDTERIREAIKAGCRIIAENKIQEALNLIFRNNTATSFNGFAYSFRINRFRRHNQDNIFRPFTCLHGCISNVLFYQF